MDSSRTKIAAVTRRIYKTFVSTQMSLVFLGILVVFFFIGTVFPQSSEPGAVARYGQAGGKFVQLVQWFGLLDLFHSWLFLAITFLFVIHLFLCVANRFSTLRRRPKLRRFAREDLVQREHSFSVISETGKDKDIERTLRRLGFKRLRHYSEDAHAQRVVCERGLPFRWLSLGYHVTLLLACAGFLLTYLFAFEGNLTLSTGERKKVPTRPTETNWNRITRRVGVPFRLADSGPIEIELREFTVEYVQESQLRYPEKVGQRILAPWVPGRERVAYVLARDAVSPRDWFSTLELYEDGYLVGAKRVEANDPLHYAGIIFYQIGCEYEFQLQVGDETLDAIVAEEPFTISQFEGTLRLRTPHAGRLYTYDGRVVILAPSTKLLYRPPRDATDDPWATIAELALGEKRTVMHTELTLTSMKKSSVLRYRYDPGASLLWGAASLLLALMCLRIYLPWYQVRVLAEHTAGRAHITVSVRMVGLFARPERMKERLCATFSR